MTCESSTASMTRGCLSPYLSRFTFLDDWHYDRKLPASRTYPNLRLPLEFMARLDHYIDRLETQTGQKANRGMIARRALELFLETHKAD